MPRGHDQIMTPNHLPDFDSLTITNRNSKSVTYLSFGSFDFQTVWAEFKNIGASSCNIHSSPDNEAIEVEIFFESSIQEESEEPEPAYAAWQYVVSAICVTGISAAAFI